MNEPGGRRLRAWRRFHVRITALFALPLLAILAVVGWLEVRRAVADEHEVLRARLRALSVAAAAALDASDVATSGPAHERLEATLAAIARDQADVVAIYVLVPEDDRGAMRFVADWDRRGLTVMPGMPYDASSIPRLVAAVHGPQVETTAVADAWGPTLSGYAPIRDAGGRASAIVGVDIAAKTIAAREREAIRHTATVFGAALLLLVLVGAVVGRTVRRPIARIVKATTAVAGGDLQARVAIDRTDELGVLAAHFDRMAAGLQERERLRAMFGRYVSEDVARAVLASPEAASVGGDLREVTILFSDLRGYSTIVEHLAPTDVIGLVNRYLDDMGGLVDAHGGCVLELLGDGILAVFGAPVRTHDHEAQAIACAEAMHARLAELNRAWEASGQARAWQDRGLPSLAMRIGVHRGKVVAGNIGGATRMKYAVLGDAVNVAARLEQLNKTLGTSLLFSAAVRDRLPAGVRARAVPRGEHLLKGRGQPVQVFTLAGLGAARPAPASLGAAQPLGEGVQRGGAGEDDVGGRGGDVGDGGGLLAEEVVRGAAAGPQRAGAVEAARERRVAAGGVEEGGER